MSDRKPNELLISVEVADDLFRLGTPSYRVKAGPAVEAHIVGAHFDASRGWIVLEYDRPVDDCLFVSAAAAVA